MYKFIVYDTLEEGLAKADEEGRAKNLPYYENPKWFMRYVTEPFPTNDAKWALDVTNYSTLTAEENALVVTTVNA